MTLTINELALLFLALYLICIGLITFVPNLKISKYVTAALALIAGILLLFTILV